MIKISAFKLYKSLFQETNLKSAYYAKIAHKASPGIDKVFRKAFEKKIDENIQYISERALKGNYNYIAYKEKLISKGKGKFPRVISIPAIRDKVALSVLNDVLTETFSDKVRTKLTQNIIDDLSNSIKTAEYDYFLKIDIQAFYDNINHDILLKKIQKKIKSKVILKLIQDAIQNPTMQLRGKKERNRIGVPQGVSISNILANIYLADLDKKYSSISTIAYFRYVDDILILCRRKNKNRILKSILKQLNQNLNLSTNDKLDEGLLVKGFEYLGYKYTLLNKKENFYGFTVKDKNLLKLESSLTKIFSDFKKDKKKNIFLWNLNLRITGFILDNRKYGWLFFYSQIDDLSKLYHLDWFVKEKMCELYAVEQEEKREIKSFVRTYFEIVKKRGKSDYIPKTEKYSVEEQKAILINIFGMKAEDIDFMNDKQITIAFRNKMYLSVKELERDVQSFS